MLIFYFFFCKLNIQVDNSEAGEVIIEEIDAPERQNSQIRKDNEDVSFNYYFITIYKIMLITLIYLGDPQKGKLIITFNCIKKSSSESGPKNGNIRN